MYTIKEVAKKLDMTEHTIRFYSDMRLIPSLKRDLKNKRIFDDSAINWLTGVKYLRDCEMSIQNIKEYFNLCMQGDVTIQQCYEILMRQQEITAKQLKETKERLECLTNKIEHFKNILENKIPDDCNPINW